MQYHAETGDYNVTVERDERTAVNPTGRRKVYRYQVQGPTAMQVLEKATGGALPEIKFFNMGELKIAGHRVRALHHGMSGAPGLELFGPWEEGDEVKAAIVEAGEEFGLRQVGARVYATNTLESGWIPCPLPAVFTGDEMKSYREWLPANGYEATGSLGGSYYLRRHRGLLPHAARPRLRRLRQLDHDFIGRDALEAMDEPAAAQGHARVERRGRRERDRHAVPEGRPAAKYIDFPLSNYSTWPNDRLMAGDHAVGVSTFSGYSYNERSFLSLGVVDNDVEIGNEVRSSGARRTAPSDEAGRRAARPGGDPGDRQPVPVQRRAPHDVRRGMAHEGRCLTTLREQLGRSGSFVVAAELVTSRGLLTAASGRAVLEIGRELAADPRVDVLSITDNPGGHAMLAPDMLGTDLIGRGQEVIIHLACKDWNRNALESRGWQLSSAGLPQRARALGRLPRDRPRGPRGAGVRHRLGRAAEPVRGDERRPPGRARGGPPPRPDRLLPRLRRHQPQAARAGGDAAVFKLRKKIADGARFVDQPDRLERAQGRRAPALDRGARSCR